MTAHNLEDVLTRLRDEFIARQPQRLGALQDQFAAVLRAEPDSAINLQRAAHSLMGAAGVHRLLEVSDAARAVEQVLARWTERGAPAAQQINTLHDAMNRLKLTMIQPTGSLTPSPTRAARSPRILVVDDDAEQALWLRSVLESASYVVEVFLELAAFRRACEGSEPPAAVIMDMVFPEGEDAGAQFVSELKEHGLKNTPVIFLSVRQDMASRLAAYRTGATSYLTKPVDSTRLLRVVSETASLAPT